MSSLHLYAESIARQRGITGRSDQTPARNELHLAGERSRRGHTSRGRIAVALAVAAGLGSGCAAVVGTPGHTANATAHTLSISPSAQVVHAGATSASFVRRIRALEARGYVEVACQVDGDLMFNPRTNRYATVRA
jgi:hypothetical protein